MQPAEWQLVRKAFDDLVELRPAERGRRLARLDLPPPLADELQGLLAAADASGDFLEGGAKTPPAEDVPSDYRSLPAGTRIGAFALEALVGRGGQGEVYRAVRDDGHFEQVVALKLLRPEAIRQAARFRAERQILAGLDHPAIGRLIDGGTSQDGRPYLAMEFVIGLPITDHCEAEGLGLAARIELMRVVADAVAHAHRHLVVHRDLKPGNVLVTAEGQVKLLDFGIARILAESNDATLTEAVLTASYAAPEQFEGRNVTTASDVYALGALLFELLTGRPPWRDGGGLPGAARLLDDEPPRASRCVEERTAPFIHPDDLVGDLDAIIAKAMRSQPRDRYESATAFEADLVRHLDLRPVEARAGDGAYRVRRFLLRNRGRVAAGLVTGATIAAGIAAWGAQARRTGIERAVAREENARWHALREYVMLTLRTASREGGPSFRTAKQILDRTAAEVARELEAPPSEAAARSGLGLLRVLGELYIEMDDFEAAAPLIEREAALADHLGDGAALARARQNLAIVDIKRGRLDDAEDMLGAADDVWSRDAARFAREAAEAAGIRAALLRERGSRPAGLSLLRNAIDRTRIVVGPDSHEEATLQHNLGVHLLEMGFNDEAEAAFARASDLIVAQGRARSTLGIGIANHRAGLALREGRTDEAEAMWREAADLRRDLYGPSAALAFTQMNLARLLLILGRHEEARPILEEATEMALAFAGRESAVTVLLRQSRSLVLGLAGCAEEASREIEETLEVGAAAFGEGHIYQAFGHATRAQLRLFVGDVTGARADLAAARSVVDLHGPEGAPHRAELDQLAAMIDATAEPQSDPVISR